MKTINNEILNAVNVYKFDTDKLTGVYVRGGEVTMTDGMTLHVMKNREDTGINKVLNSYDLKVAQKGIIKKQPFSLLEEGVENVRVNGVDVHFIDGAYPDYKQILKSSYIVSARLEIKMLISTLQVLQKLGAGSVEISIEDLVKPIALKGLTQFGEELESHVVSIQMPMIPQHTEIDTSKVLGVLKEVETSPEVTQPVVSRSSDDEDLPF